MRLAKADGLRVIADASQADQALVSSLGAEVVVRRGDDVADRIRAVMPAGVDAVADGAASEAKVVPAVRHGGGLAVIHGWAGPAERGIAIHQTLVTGHAHNQPRSTGCEAPDRRSALPATWRVTGLKTPRPFATAPRD